MNNPNLVDDNFQSMENFDNQNISNNDSDEEMETFENYNTDNVKLQEIYKELKENFSDGFVLTNEENNNIEQFSNNNCPLCWGDRINITNTKRDRFVVINRYNITFSKDSKYKKPVYFVPPKGKSYKEIGPYEDRGSRALRYGPMEYGFTPESCAEATKGYKYFSLQNDGWCAADNDFDHATKYGTEGWGRRCYYGPKGIRGGGKQGGPWCNYIFQNIPSNLEEIKGKPIKYGDIININTKFEEVGGSIPYKAPFVFYYNQRRMTFNDHARYARYLGGELASITNSSEMNAIKKFPRTNCWIGGKRIKNNKNDGSSSTWRWIDGSKWSYTYWHGGQPDHWQGKENCVHLTTHRDRSWNDISGNHRFTAIYKIPKAALEEKKRGSLRYEILPGYGNFSKKGDMLYYNQNVIFKDVSETYYKTPKNLQGTYSDDKGCPPGYKTLKNDTECRFTAVKELGLRRGVKWNWHDRPEGCFLHHNNHLYYNTKKISRNQKLVGDDKSICKKVDDNQLEGDFHSERSAGQSCSMKYPRFIEDGNYRIKKIKARCDDKFDLYIDGRVYSGSGWNKTFTFTDIPTYRKSGFMIAVRCYNYGGPGCFMAEIELTNGSVIFTDGEWDYCLNPRNASEFLRRPYTYNYDQKRWRNPNVLGMNMKDKIKWNGKLKPNWDRYFVDSNFSPLNHWISQSNVYRKGYFYFKRVIGQLPDLSLCRHKFSFGEALCYLEANPDVEEYVRRIYSTDDYEYLYNDTRMTWNDHQNEAKRRGGHLASITSDKELGDARKILNANNPGGWGFWIGGYRKNNKSYCRSGKCWGWVDGREFKYDGWWPRYEPNNWRETRIHMWTHGGGTWNDLPPSYKLAGLYRLRKKDVNIDINKLVDFAKYHWKYYGCVEGRNFNCSKPPSTIGKYDYKGCYYDGHIERALPNYRGKVNSLEECRAIAENKRDTIFGVMNGEDCYTGNDMTKLKKYGMANKCSRLGRASAYQVFERRKPFDPMNAKLTKKNYTEKFTNMSSSNMKYIILLILIVLISILFYTYKCN